MIGKKCKCCSTSSKSSNGGTCICGNFICQKCIDIECGENHNARLRSNARWEVLEMARNKINELPTAKNKTYEAGLHSALNVLEDLKGEGKSG